MQSPSSAPQSSAAKNAAASAAAAAMKSDWDPLNCPDWSGKLNPSSLERLQSDLQSIFKGPPQGIFAIPDENDMSLVHAMIVGPFDTPYEGGFFYFVMRIPPEYPHKSPRVRLITTGGDTVRFNPNLYANGKVCLSILGTWSGPGWTAGLTLGGVLISIQSLMNQKPYHNAPGYESEHAPGDSYRYNQVIEHETIRVAVCEMLEGSSSAAKQCSQMFTDVMRNTFRRVYNKHMDTCQKLIDKGLQDRPMSDPFSERRGKFDPKGLMARLKQIRSTFSADDMECVSMTKSLVLSELQTEGSMISDKVYAHGLTWTVLYWWDQVAGLIYYSLGLDQPPDCIVGAAVRASVVVESSCARVRRTSQCFLVCTDAKHFLKLFVIAAHPSETDLLIENGALKVTITLEVFKPTKFRSISPRGAVYRTTAPPSCVAILGIDHQDTVYVLLRKLSVLSPETWQYQVYCFRRFLPHDGITLAKDIIDRNPTRGCRGSGFDPENKRLAVTQIYNQNTLLQLDIVDWESGHHTTRTYELLDQDLRWSAATPHAQDWVCVASGVRADPPIRTLHHRFWSLADDGLNLLTEFVQETDCEDYLPANSAHGYFYCLVRSNDHCYRLWVSCWEQPHDWQPYQLAPFPSFPLTSLRHGWGHMHLVGLMFNSGPDTNIPERQIVIFKLRFELTDCVLEPYLILPKEIVENDWKITGDEDIVTLERKENLLRYMGIHKPASLKINALMVEQAAHKDWKEKLIQILGQQCTNSFLT